MHKRRAAPCSILRCIKAFTAQGMGNERLAFEVVVTGTAFGADGGRYVDRPARVIAAVGDKFRDYGVLPPRLSGSLKSPATADKARNNIVGKAFPRLSARRRIPRQAFALK